ncbi:MAG TPA: hypothetical protein PKL49_11525 [Steroidobacteraceae bacterium]|nr:hypothetical protein [Steroidobacteraceae bacterium]HNS27768.1 hypothetical protein [Steroidobacteraceae bacterium]
MLLVHHLEYSRSQPVHWLLQELGLPRQARCHARDPATLALERWTNPADVLNRIHGMLAYCRALKRGGHHVYV